MLNSLIGLPSNEEEVLNKILNKVSDENAEEIAFSFSNLVSAYIRNKKMKLSEGLKDKIEKKEIVVHLELAKEYLRELEFAGQILVPLFEEKFSFDTKVESLIELVEKNQASNVIKRFGSDPNCESLMEDFEKFFKYFKERSILFDINEEKKMMKLNWISGKFPKVFISFFKIEFLNIKYHLTSSEKPEDAYILEQ